MITDRGTLLSGSGFMVSSVAKHFPVLVAMALLALAGGCARYEYDLVRPPELAQHIGTKAWSTVPLDDLEYRLLTSDNRLVMLIYNRGEQTVKLSEADSVVVDPRGESRPLVGRTIVAGSYAKLIFPPPRPQFRSYGPTVGVGVGYSRYYGQRYHDGFGYGPGFGAYDDLEPRYYNVYDVNDRRYFDWPGDTEVRLLLAYERERGEPFRHDLVFRRRRM